QRLNKFSSPSEQGVLPIDHTIHVNQVASLHTLRKGRATPFVSKIAAAAGKANSPAARELQTARCQPVSRNSKKIATFSAARFNSTRAAGDEVTSLACSLIYQQKD